MPYFSKKMFLVVISIFWSLLKRKTPKDFAIANFGCLVSKSWLRPFSGLCAEVTWNLGCFAGELRGIQLD